MKPFVLIMEILAVAAGAAFLFWLRTFPFREKKHNVPEQSAPAAVWSKRIHSGNPDRSGRSMMGYTFLVTFRLENGQELELHTYEVEYGGLQEGDSGILTWKGPYFVSFEREENP